MLITIPNVLSKGNVALFRQVLDEAKWQDGAHTAGAQSQEVKRNQQLPISSPEARQLGDRILEALSQNPLFLSAALPLKILPPMFNKYESEETFGAHVDNSIRAIPGTPERIRTDLSCTLFLAEPDEYEGGELVVEDHYGTQEVKLAAGDLVLYPSTSLHQVVPVRSGARVASFFWLQSMIRLDAHRSMLFDLDQSIQTLTAQLGSNDPSVLRLSGIYHNLIRTWAET